MGSWTGIIPDDGPAAAAVALIGPDAGPALGGGTVRSQFGVGELVVTEGGLYACDLPSGEALLLPWSTFDRDRIELGPPNGPSTLAFDVDGDPLFLSLDSALAAFVIGASGRYWFHGREGRPSVPATTSDPDGGWLPSRRVPGASHPLDRFLPSPTPAQGEVRDERPTGLILLDDPFADDPLAPYISLAGSTGQPDAVVRHRGNPLGFAAAVTVLTVLGTAAFWSTWDAPANVSSDLDGYPAAVVAPATPPASTPTEESPEIGFVGDRGAAGAASAGPTTNEQSSTTVAPPDGPEETPTSLAQQTAESTPAAPPAAPPTTAPPVDSLPDAAPEADGGWRGEWEHDRGDFWDRSRWEEGGDSGEWWEEARWWHHPWWEDEWWSEQRSGR